ncbi:MAG: hypothetical protein NZM43_09720 [Saprospiraceae bacterium]|nr:hypothetical protein [Saprospiraceae bacterium]MDW8484593.1 hypothetical protein [Saprospiraceae bacterium]
MGIIRKPIIHLIQKLSIGWNKYSGDAQVCLEILTFLGTRVVILLIIKDFFIVHY